MQVEFDEGPWYKQFWAWFVLTPLLVVVVACCGFLTLAILNADDVVIDNYYQQGRAINQRFDQDEKALTLNLSGRLTFDLELGEVLLSIQGDTSLPEKLLLMINHPVNADYDQRIVLHLITDGRYRGDLDFRPQHRWYLQLLPVTEPSVSTSTVNSLLAKAQWRLTSEIGFSTNNPHSSVFFGQKH